MTMQNTAAKLGKLLDGMLVFDPESRMSMEDVLKDPFWYDEDTLEEDILIENFWKNLKSNREKHPPEVAVNQKKVFQDDSHKLVFIQQD